MQTKIISPELLEQFLSDEFQARFWARVKIGNANECWPWIAYAKPGKYGTLTVSRLGQKATFSSHRLAWIVANGYDIPAGMHALHYCVGNTLCCNPDHIRPGTQTENTADMDQQGRRVRLGLKGEENRSSKLTNIQVLEIRNRFSIGETNKAALARRFGVTPRVVALILWNKIWRHI